MTIWPLLVAAIDIGETAMEKLIVGLEVTAIGMAVVFGVLVLLCYALIAVGSIVGGRSSRPGPAVPIPSAGDSEGPDLVVPSGLDPGTGAGPASGEPSSLARGVAPGYELAAAISAAVAAVVAKPVVWPAASPRPPLSSRGIAKPGWAWAGRFELITARERLPRG